MWHETLGDRDFRPPYLPAFFTEAARRLRLSRHEALLDLGCGFGTLAFGLAPHVATITGLDAELPALTLMAERGRALGVSVRAVHARIEAAPADLGSFDLITLGKSYWYMEPAAAAARIDGWLRPGGRVMICGPSEAQPDGEPWQRMFYLMYGRWQRGPKGDPRRLSPEKFLGAGFEAVDRIDVYGEQMIDLEHLIRRAYGFPETSRAALGADAERMADDYRRVMGRFFRNGPIRESLHTGGIIFRRRGDEQSAA